MKKSAITFTILIVVTIGILFGLMEANKAYQNSYIIIDISKAKPIDDYPYAPFNIIHSQLKPIDTISVWPNKWGIKSMNLRDNDIE